MPLIPFMAWGLVELTGLGVFWFFGPMFVYGIMPGLDHLIGKDSSNPPDSVLKWLQQDRYYRWCTYAYIPLQFAALIAACWVWAHGDLSLIEKLGLALTIGLVGGIAINTAHELGHKRASLEKWLSKMALAQTAYGHFFIEHNRGHHVRVATPEDPASSRLGESFYRFLPRTVAGSLRSAWELESERLGRSGGSSWTLRNDILNAWAMTLVLFGGLTAVFGLEVLPWLLLQGRLRLLAARGRQLPRALRPAARAPRGRALRAHSARALVEQRQRVLQRAALPPAAPFGPPRPPAAPLPGPASLRRGAGAALGLRDDDVLAVIPPLWRRVMDPRLAAHYEGDLTRANRGAASA